MTKDGADLHVERWRDHWVLEFWRASEMIAHGRRAAEAELPEIRRRIASLGGRIE